MTRANDSVVTTTPKIRFSLRTLFTLVTLCAIGSCVAISFKDRVTCNANRDKVPFKIPADATHINYLLPDTFGPNTYLEFDTSEQSFLEWVKTNQVVKQVTEKPPYLINRYSGYGPDEDLNYEVTINNGYLYEWAERDMGEHVAFDRDTGRAYYHRHTR